MALILDLGLCRNGCWMERLACYNFIKSSNSLFSSNRREKLLCANSKAHNVTWVLQGHSLFTKSDHGGTMQSRVYDCTWEMGLTCFFFLNWWDMLKVLGRERYMSTFLSPVKPPGDQICWSEGGVRGACQQNRPISEQLVVLLHQATPEVLGQQGGKHLEGDWEKDNVNIIMDWKISSVLLLPFNDSKESMIDCPDWAATVSMSTSTHFFYINHVQWLSATGRYHSSPYHSVTLW